MVEWKLYTALRFDKKGVAAIYEQIFVFTFTWVMS